MSMFERIKAWFRPRHRTDADWPFADPPNRPVLTTRHVLRLGKPILHVFHEADGSGWQFHYGGSKRATDAMVVALQEILVHDRSTAELADLPLGWHAERETIGQSWVRHP